MIVQKKTPRALRIAAVTAGALLIGVPFYWLALSALKYQQDVLAYPPSLVPTSIRWDNVTDALALLTPRAILNSAIFTVTVSALQWALVITTGFVLAKMRFKGRQLLFVMFVATLLVPFHVMLIPTFMVVRELEMLDSYAGLILPVVAQTSFGVFLYRQFFVTLPDDLLHAARVDGAHWGQTFWHIAMPLAGPPTAAYLSVTVLNAWNMYVWPLVAVTSADMRVLPLTLARLGDDFSLVPPNVAMMSVLLSTLPVFIVFIFTQRWFVRGLGGAVKE